MVLSERSQAQKDAFVLSHCGSLVYTHEIKHESMNHMEVEVKRLGDQKGLVGGGGAGESGK